MVSDSESEPEEAGTGDKASPMGWESPLGWDEQWTELWLCDSHPGLSPALVTRIDKGGITVGLGRGSEQLVVAAKGSRHVVVGDMVALDRQAGRIEQILPRRTVFERRSPGVGRDQIQISSRALAANMDTVLVLQPLDRGVNLPRLARELVLAWESGAQPIVVLTKSDLVSAEERELQRSAAFKFAPGVDVLAVSAHQGPNDPTDSVVHGGMIELEPFLGPSSITVLLGASGAGKSSLVNALAGRPVQLTAEVRGSDRKGRHTTTAGQIVELRSGALLIDTPGIRGVGLWAADEGFERTFADLVPFVENCRFDDCTHTSEPGCGLLEAAEQGLVDQYRIEIFQALATELDQLEEGIEVLERNERKERNQRARRKARRRDEGIEDN